MRLEDIKTGDRVKVSWLNGTFRHGTVANLCGSSVDGFAECMVVFDGESFSRLILKCSIQAKIEHKEVPISYPLKATSFVFQPTSFSIIHGAVNDLGLIRRIGGSTTLIEGHDVSGIPVSLNFPIGVNLDAARKYKVTIEEIS